MPILTSFSTPQDLRDLARDEVEGSGHSRAEIARRLDVARANVSKALGDGHPPTLYLNINRRILEEIFQYDVGTTEHFRIESPVERTAKEAAPEAAV